MDSKNFLKIFKDSFQDLIKNPVISIPSVLLLIFSIFLSKLSVKINYSLTNTFSITTWLIFYSLISLLFMSFFFSSLIGMSGEAIKGKTSIISIVKYPRRFWLSNFIIILIILLLYNLVNFISHYSSLFIGKALEASLQTAQIIFYLFYFTGLVGIMIFMTFSSFFLILKNKTIIGSIISSFNFVKNNYIYVLLCLLSFFIVGELIKLTPTIAQEFIGAIFLTPYISLVLARFLIKSTKN